MDKKWGRRSAKTLSGTTVQPCHDSYMGPVLVRPTKSTAHNSRGTVFSGPTYLLSDQKPTLDETVQHLLTVAVGRLARLGRKASGSLRRARKGLRAGVGQAQPLL